MSEAPTLHLAQFISELEYAQLPPSVREQLFVLCLD